MSSYEELKQLFEKENKLDLFEKKVDETCLVVIRQTDYDKEKALEKLKEHNMVTLDVIKEYMGIPLKREMRKVTTNQAIFREFRTFLDEACSNYNKQKEMEQQKQLYMERVMAAQKKKLLEENKKKKLEPIKED
jgi:hypothetical protein